MPIGAPPSVIAHIRYASESNTGAASPSGRHRLGGRGSVLPSPSPRPVGPWQVADAAAGQARAASRAFHSAGPFVWIELPRLSTATVTGMSATRNS